MEKYFLEWPQSSRDTEKLSWIEDSRGVHLFLVTNQLLQFLFWIEIAQERRVPYSQAIRLSMVMLYSQPDHHWDQKEVNVKDRSTVIRGEHGQEQYLSMVYEMRARVKSYT
jgi:hypothetical protein